MWLSNYRRCVPIIWGDLILYLSAKIFYQTRTNSRANPEVDLAAQGGDVVSVELP